MSEYAEDAYWTNLVSLFRVTLKTSCDFFSDFHGKLYVPIIYLCMLNNIEIRIVITGCPKKWVIYHLFLTKSQEFVIYGSVDQRRHQFTHFSGHHHYLYPNGVQHT